jgi:hypothetical protein
MYGMMKACAPGDFLRTPSMANYRVLPATDIAEHVRTE